MISCACIIVQICMGVLLLGTPQLKRYFELLLLAMLCVLVIYCVLIFVVHTFISPLSSYWFSKSLNCAYHFLLFAFLKQIDLLIVDINHISCYDMIEQFCEYILSQLPSLQKQRYPLPKYFHLWITHF